MTTGRNQIWRVAVVEDHLLQRLRTEELLQRDGDLEVVFSGESAPDFLTWAASVESRQRPHLLVLDLQVDRKPSVSVDLVADLVAAGLKIVVLSALGSPILVRDIVRAGAHGVVGKRDPEEDIMSAIRAALRGEEWMTSELASVIAGDESRPRLSIQEERALVLYASGLTLDQVAGVMYISRDTARQYLDRVKKKYAASGVKVTSKLDFGRVAWADGYLDPMAPTAGIEGSDS